MSTPNGYNNPAYCHQYDTSLYDYEYVPEIDPDSPQTDRRIEQTRLVHPRYPELGNFSASSEEFDGSDESNRSIIVEECNNRRITLICEKRTKPREHETHQYLENGNSNGAYYQDISLESENGYRDDREETSRLRHKRKLDPPVELRGDNQNYTSSNVRQPDMPPPRRHRYEEIDFDENYDAERTGKRDDRASFRHRYAEISTDENGYPSLEGEFEIERQESRFLARSSSPNDHPKSFSPDFDPRQTYQRAAFPYPPDQDFRCPKTAPLSPKKIAYAESPARSNVIELSELSPPKLYSSGFVPRSGRDGTAGRQPPVGASSPSDVRDPCRKTNKNPISKNLQKITLKMSQGKQNSPRKTDGDNKTRSAQVFHAKSSTPKSSSSSTPMPKSSTPRTKGTGSRRNISDSFTDPPKLPSGIKNPYAPTTMEVKSKTAIITPIFQRKIQPAERSTESDFKKISQMFQSTGNIMQNPLDRKIAESVAYPNRARIKRNQSVPNFAQTFANETRVTPKKYKDYSATSNAATFKNSVRHLDYQYSPTKSIDRFSPIDRSRLSLIDRTKSSWSNLGSELQSPPTGCLTLAAVIQLFAGIASCAVGFYLFSKVGRRYYLDFGILAGFVSLLLGALGFRSHCWRWLPNRNYVSGYIVLAAFSVLTSGGLIFLVTAKPMAGDPILDVMGGAICGVSVLTIIIAITGLTMSGCCKTPPPDNRVTNI